MTSIGETLRRERQRRNLDLDQVSRELKISSRFLEAIEEQQFDRLPGGVFARSFVRQYARMLGLDEEEAADEMQKLIAPPETAPVEDKPKEKMPEFHVPRMEAWESVGDRKPRWLSSLPALALMVVVMLGCSMVYGWWQRERQHNNTAAGQVTPGVVHKMPPVQAAHPRPQSPPAAVPNPVPAQPSAVPPNAASAPSTAATGGASAPAGAMAAAETPADSGGAPVRVQLVASEPVWVRVQTDGKYSFSGVLSANETRTVEASNQVTLRLGNAGGITILLNGKPIGNVGPKGQVRTIQLTSGGFQVVAAPKPLADPLL
jgi:cytoskeleton protein RodZ